MAGLLVADCLLCLAASAADCSWAQTGAAPQDGANLQLHFSLRACEMSPSCSHPEHAGCKLTMPGLINDTTHAGNSACW
jgi:hypothetical protein